MEASEIYREIILKEYLESHLPDKEIDLQHLRDAELISNNPRLYHVKNLWLLSFRRSRLFDDWARKAKRLVYEAGHPDTDMLVEKLASALDSRLDIFHPAWSRVLHVPFDLSLPIRDQLEHINSTLTGIRNYLYRFTTQPPPRDRIEFVWRDTYVFLRSALQGSSVAEIAEEVFPSDRKESRQVKVRQILRKVNLAVKKARIILPPVKVKIDPPANLNPPS
jgi:hypothetical protein